MEKIGMRDQVEDTITGFKGTVTGYAVYLNGCRKIMVQPRVDKDGNVRDAQWIDEQDVAVIEGADAPRAPVAAAGGPQATPPGY